MSIEPIEINESNALMLKVPIHIPSLSNSMDAGFLCFFDCLDHVRPKDHQEDKLKGPTIVTIRNTFAEKQQAFCYIAFVLQNFCKSLNELLKKSDTSTIKQDLTKEHTINDKEIVAFIVNRIEYQVRARNPNIPGFIPSVSVKEYITYIRDFYTMTHGTEQIKNLAQWLQLINACANHMQILENSAIQIQHTIVVNRTGIPWRIVFTRPSLSGVWAAVAAGLSVTLRTEVGLQCHVIPLV